MSECKQIELQAHRARSLHSSNLLPPTPLSLRTHAHPNVANCSGQKVIQIAHCAGPNMIAITVGKSVDGQIWYNPRLSVDTLGCEKERESC